MKRIIDINTWKRKEHFEFFNSMNDPFTGVVANVDCTKAYNQAKELQTSFYLSYLHKSLLAANQIEAFRYRIENNTVVCYDQVHAGATTDNTEGTFSFVFLYFHELYSQFETDAKAKIEIIRKTGKLGFGEEQRRTDCIHYTTMPWVRFTGLKHANNIGSRVSCPKISFGHLFEENNKRWLPVSVEIHHALMDGRQIGEYYKLFQHLLDKIE